MTLLVADLSLQTAQRSSARQAPGYGAQAITYAELAAGDCRATIWLRDAFSA